jgi:hypothetical protein
VRKALTVPTRTWSATDSFSLRGTDALSLGLPSRWKSPIGLSAASFWNEKPGGEESIIHRLAAKNPCSVVQAIWLEA